MCGAQIIDIASGALSGIFGGGQAGSQAGGQAAAANGTAADPSANTANGTAADPSANTADGTPQAAPHAARTAKINSGRNTQGGRGGGGSTMLTGGMGAAPEAGTLGKTTLLGG